MITLGLEGVAAVEVGIRMPRVDLDRLRIIGDGGVALALGLVDDAPANVRVGVLRIDLDSLAVIVCRGRHSS